MRASVASLDPDTYIQHALHQGERDWAETNCYVDVVIELLHGLGHEPMAALPFTVGIDFEGDQWTFFKFPIADLYELFGLDIQELTIWSSLVGQVAEQVKRGRPVLVEMDSFFLPDTAGTSYQLAHVKSTIGVMDIDVEHRTLGYFHGQGYYHLAGEDFASLFHLGEDLGQDGWLPPYVELVKMNPERALTGPALVDRSVELLRTHLERRPSENPVAEYRSRFMEDLVFLKEQPLEFFHQYSFATLRQAGACFELSAQYLNWLVGHGHAELEPAETHFRALSSGAKTLQFKLARMMGRKKEIDLGPALDEIEQSWDHGMGALAAAL